jgi:3-dehydroquinate synthase
LKRLTLKLPHSRCDVWIGAGALARLPGLLQSMFGAPPAVVADRNTARYARGLTGAPIVLPAGEPTKNPRQLFRLWNQFAERRVDRYTPIVAVGGGVIGDLAGFAASTYMRGVPLVHVPTTLLAQVDSAIGGKTAVNLPQGKNLAGTFYQPRLVVIDPETLSTLPEREYRTGLAEAIKYGMIRDRALFERMESNVEKLAARDPKLLEEIIIRCVSIKLAVVRVDEREGGLRMILNYGHTIGHAIERATGYRLTHGEAISIGMNREAEIAVKMGLCPEKVRVRQNALIRAAGLPLEGRVPAEAVRAAMALDKKAKSGKIRFVLPRAVGKVQFPVVVPTHLL